MPEGRLHIGHRFATFIDNGDCIEVEFENGARTRVEALVGADGIHSGVRRVVFGPENPHFTGCVAYRGLVPAERLAHLGLEVTTQVWLGSGKHFVHYFVGWSTSLLSSKRRAGRANHGLTGVRSPTLAAYEGWHPQVHSILAAVDDTFIWALFDRKPMVRWSLGRVTLLGDACHAMLPFMAQGAAQAIEDGATLAACLSQIDARDVPEALRRYENLRLPRSSRVQALSEANKVRFHLPDGPTQQERDAEMARGTTDWSLKALAWLYGHDAAALDATS